MRVVVEDCPRAHVGVELGLRLRVEGLVEVLSRTKATEKGDGLRAAAWDAANMNTQLEEIFNRETSEVGGRSVKYAPRSQAD